MICNCILAGTKACNSCLNNQSYSEYNFPYSNTNIDNVNINDMKIIGGLNKHIDDLREENKRLRKEIEELKNERL